MIFQIRNPQSHMFPIDLSITRIGKHTRAIWSFFMVPRSGASPEFKAGQVVVLRMGDCNDTYIAFASAPEEARYAAHGSLGGALLTTERSRDRIQLRLRVSRNVLHPVINRAKEIFYNVFGLHENLQENGFSRHTFHVRLL